MKQILQSFLLFILVCSLCNSVSAATNERIFTVAVVPQFSLTQAHRDWTPLLSRLEQATGYRFQLLAFDRFAHFESEMRKGKPDLILMNPYHMTEARQKHGYLPLVRDSTPFSGILVVRKDSTIKTLAALEGQTIAFPSPNAFAASLYIRALLAEKIHIKTEPVYVGNHQNVYRHVLLGEAVAGGGVTKSLQKEPEAVRSRLKVIFTTPSLASHPLAAHPRVPAAARKKIVDALLAMRTDPEASKLLANVQMPQPVKAVYSRDYAGLAKLRLDRYADSESQ
jgi:phosphonate transport system substrate-binding protein